MKHSEGQHKGRVASRVPPVATLLSTVPRQLVGRGRGGCGRSGVSDGREVRDKNNNEGV